VNERDGVLVLSREAGVWGELADHALGVNPFDISGTAAAIARALDLSPVERRSRAAGLREAASARTPLDWFDDLLRHSGVVEGGRRREKPPGAGAPNPGSAHR
ncbi:MAG TPA: trehalose-6-phosphate synthase, partial [Acidimicrobiales bacterium]|nr:trehalose-6-phosphate synthase [Acidimicrobiales bacterium]